MLLGALTAGVQAVFLRQDDQKVADLVKDAADASGASKDDVKEFVKEHADDFDFDGDFEDMKKKAEKHFGGDDDEKDCDRKDRRGRKDGDKDALAQEGEEKDGEKPEGDRKDRKRGRKGGDKSGDKDGEDDGDHERKAKEFIKDHAEELEGMDEDELKEHARRKMEEAGVSKEDAEAAGEKVKEMIALAQEGEGDDHDFADLKAAWDSMSEEERAAAKEEHGFDKEDEKRARKHFGDDDDESDGDDEKDGGDEKDGDRKGGDRKGGDRKGGDRKGGDKSDDGEKPAKDGEKPAAKED